MAILRLTFISTLLSFAVAACTSTEGTNQSALPSHLFSSGNGDSYQGKAYKYQNPSGSCPTDFESVILYNADGEFFLAKENCQAVEPHIQLDPAQINHDFQRSQLIYDGDTYVNIYNPACNYEEYTGSVSTGGDCSAADMEEAVVTLNQVASGGRVELVIYNAASETHNFNSQKITFQKVSLAAGLAANSVDVVVSSYEPVRWEFEGNVAAIRSVHVRGYHCALTTGVDPAKVSISTYEQGTSPNTLAMPLSLNLLSTASFYDGTCAPNRTFVIQ